MIEMVKQAQGSRAPVARLADVVSGYFTVGVLVGRGGDVRGVAVVRAVRHRDGERGGGADHRLPLRARAWRRPPRSWWGPAAAPSAAS